MKKFLFNFYFILAAILFLLLGLWFGKEAIKYLPYYYEEYTNIKNLIIRDFFFSIFAFVLCAYSIVLLVWVNTKNLQIYFSKENKETQRTRKQQIKSQNRQRKIDKLQSKLNSLQTSEENKPEQNG